MKIFILEWSVPDQYSNGYERSNSRKLFLTKESALAEKIKLEEAIKILGMYDTSLRSVIIEYEITE